MMRADTEKENPMPGYTIVNLLEIDDAVQGRVPGVEGRFSRKYLDSRDLGVSHWRMRRTPAITEPTATASRRRPTSSSPAPGRVRLDDELRDIRLWDVIRVAPEVVRAFEAGPDGLELIAVGGPKPEGGDGVRAESAVARRR